MARILLPSLAPDSEQTRSFRTHASYIRAFRELALGEKTSGLEDVVARLHASAAPILYRPPATPRLCDREQLFACLRRAWATARLLEHTHELAGDSEIIRLANSWGAVQAYYVLYGCAQALIVAEGGSRPQMHEPTKRRYVDLWTTRTVDAGRRRARDPARRRRRLPRRPRTTTQSGTAPVGVLAGRPSLGHRRQGAALHPPAAGR